MAARAAHQIPNPKVLISRVIRKTWELLLSRATRLNLPTFARFTGLPTSRRSIDPISRDHPSAPSGATRSARDSNFPANRFVRARRAPRGRIRGVWTRLKGAEDRAHSREELVSGCFGSADTPWCQQKSYSPFAPRHGGLHAIK